MPFSFGQLSHIFSLSLVVLFLSAFMNNVGALALMLPVALKTSVDRQRSPTILLLPMAFASILGGMMTMIGTPPNNIIANLRSELTEEAAFGLFDFSPVGGLSGRRNWTRPVTPRWDSPTTSAESNTM